MKIAYVGNFSQQHCTEVHIAATLERLGHQVVRIQETPTRNRDNWINKVMGCDLFLFTRTWGNMVSMQDLEAIKKAGITTASYHLDLYVGLQREGGLDRDPFWRTDFVFSPDGSEMAAKVFQAKGINHYYMKPAVFKDECIMLPSNGDNTLDGDVIFVGGGLEYSHPEWPYRHKLVQWLMDNYPGQYKKYGHPQRTVRNLELNQLYANAKVVIGDSLCLNFDHPNYWSDRVYETIGRGGFMIHPYIKGMEEEFTNGVNIVFYNYNDFDELKRKIDYYLTHDVEREKIRQEGFEFVKKHATYENRLTQMFNTIESVKVIKDDMEKTTSALHLSEEQAKDIMTDSIKINLGAGTDIQPGWVNVDHIKLDGIDVVHNLGDYPWPFEDNSATEIRAIDVLEHLPNYTKDDRPGVIAFIEECHRILKPGCEVYIQTPGWKAEFLWIDPTHVRGFDIQTMDFFDPNTHFGQTTGFYSPCKFSVKKEELQNHNLRFWMKKI